MKYMKCVGCRYEKWNYCPYLGFSIISGYSYIRCMAKNRQLNKVKIDDGKVGVYNERKQGYR